MEKKDLKFYVTPEMEEQNVELQGFLCNSPGNGTNANGFEDDDEIIIEE